MVYFCFLWLFPYSSGKKGLSSPSMGNLADLDCMYIQELGTFVP
jgi:hypothetical protein